MSANVTIFTNAKSVHKFQVHVTLKIIPSQSQNDRTFISLGIISENAKSLSLTKFENSTYLIFNWMFEDFITKGVRFKQPLKPSFWKEFVDHTFLLIDSYSYIVQKSLQFRACELIPQTSS